MPQVRKSIEVNAPLEACYRAWLKFRAYPRFLKYVECVLPTEEDGVWHWVLKFPNGETLDWDAEMLSDKNLHKVSWHTVPAPGVNYLHPEAEFEQNRGHLAVENTGSVTLEPLGPDHTLVLMAQEYKTSHPNEILEYPDGLVEETLRCFKAHMEKREQGEAYAFYPTGIYGEVP